LIDYLRTLNGNGNDVSAGQTGVVRVDGWTLVFPGVIRGNVLYQQFTAVIHDSASCRQPTGNTWPSHVRSRT